MFIMDVFGVRAIMGLQESDFPGWSQIWKKETGPGEA